MTKLFLKTLSSFYYDRMVASVPSDFTKMVNMGLRLGEGVLEGRLREGSSSDSSRMYKNALTKKKEYDANTISQEKCRRPPRNSQGHQHMASVTPIINFAPFSQVTLSYQSHFQQCTNQQNQQNHAQRPVQFDSIPMNYAKLFLPLIHKNLGQIRTPLAVSKELPWRYKPDQYCAFHQGAHGHDIENCFALKAEVRRLMQSVILSF